MVPCRVLTTFLALASLLFGNVAGWMHVGCNSATSSCCSNHSAGVTACAPRLSDTCCHQGDCGGGYDATDAASVPLPPGELSCSPLETICIDAGCNDLGCNDLGCNDAGCNDSGCNDLGDDHPREPISDHDSDQCSICLGFTASRQAAALCMVALPGRPVCISTDQSPFDAAPAEAIFLSAFSIRGPPRV